MSSPRVAILSLNSGQLNKEENEILIPAIDELAEVGIQTFGPYSSETFFGNGYYCVADASNGYFGKVPSEMNFDECTLLAGVPNAPTNYNPTASPELARQRQKQVIEKMKKAGYLEESVD